MAVVKEVRPEAVSLALRELAPERVDEAAFGDFIGWLVKENILPQIIVYTPEEAARLSRLVADGILPVSSIPVLYVLGRYTIGQVSAPADLLRFLDDPRGHRQDWMVCAFGPTETRCAALSALLGGDARVGFENNRHLPDGQTARDNAGLVEATRNAIQACGLATASAAVLRSRWVSTLSGNARQAA